MSKLSGYHTKKCGPRLFFAIVSVPHQPLLIEKKFTHGGVLCKNHIETKKTKILFGVLPRSCCVLVLFVRFLQALKISPITTKLIVT